MIVTWILETLRRHRWNIDRKEVYLTMSRKILSGT